MAHPTALCSLAQFPQPTFTTDLQGAIATDVSEEEADSPVKRVPWELVLHIFGFLSQANQGRAFCVCRQWRDVAADDSLLTTSYLKKEYPEKLQVLDEKVWKTLFGAKGLDFGNVPPLEPRMIPELGRLIDSLSREGDAGITLGFLPPGLTFNMLKQGIPAKFSCILERFLNKFGDKPVLEARWFAVTNCIVEGSRGLSMSAQRKLVKTMRCDIPGFLEMASVALLTPSHRAYTTRCWQRVGDNPVAVTFGPRGLSVSTNFAEGSIGHGVRIIGHGVAAQRKF